ncbi:MULTISPECIES: SCO family protein [unclassified Bradyrhizobium]|uniref:SCO family protein n=1 Tax=unclassified Bradyrhizobium TaxID=2631580 RepID=UPI0020123275|nr:MULTISPECIES: SCO family protein [unclassified Bradyrhizobium]
MTRVANMPPPAIGGAFSLTDHDGRSVSNETYRGRHVLIFFGFTHCRVVCPRALARLSAALDRLGPLADRIQPLYITVDPERDAPHVMRAFLRSYPRFTGLTGSRAQIDQAKTAFRVFAERVDDPAGDGYAVPHTAIAYVLDGGGAFRSHLTDALSAEEIAVRLAQLLDADGVSPGDGPINPA